MTTLDDLPDTACMRLIPAHPALSAAASETLLAALDKLFVQFAREGRLEAYALTTTAQGHLLIVAWQGGALSGCSHDKIAKLLSAHEQHAGVALLTPPPLLIEDAQGPRCLSHAEFKAGVASGAITGATLAWDTLAADLGSWRRGSRRPVAEHWLRPLWERAQGAPSSSSA